MTYEKYSQRGYLYSDWLKMSQYQKWLGVHQQIKSGKIIFERIGFWYDNDDQAPPQSIRTRLVWPWKFGWHIEQMHDAFFFGPVFLLWRMA